MRKLKLLFAACLFLCIGTVAWAGDINPDNVTKTKVTDLANIESGKVYILQTSNAMPAGDTSNRFFGHDTDGTRNIWNAKGSEGKNFLWKFVVEDASATTKRYALKSVTSQYAGVTRNNQNLLVQETPVYFEIVQLNGAGDNVGFAFKYTDADNNVSYISQGGTGIHYWNTSLSSTGSLAINTAECWYLYEYGSQAHSVTDGVYTMTSRATDRNGHLYNDYRNSANTNNLTLQSSASGTSNKYYWKVSVFGDKLSVVNGEGSRLKSHDNSGDHSYTSVSVGNVDSNGYVYFTEALNASKDGWKLSDGTPYLTTWSGHPDANDNNWKFNAVENKVCYNVRINGDELARIRRNSTDEIAFNGGFFMYDAETTPTAADFTVLGTATISIIPATDTSDGWITVTYADAYKTKSWNWTASEDDVFYIKSKQKNQYACHNTATVVGDNVILDTKSGDYDMTSFFRIAGDMRTGYTIRLANSENNYVYAINTNSNDDNVGVKTVDGTPGDECKWYIIPHNDGYNIIPKTGAYGWNVRGQGIGLWTSNNTNDNTWYLKSAMELATENNYVSSDVVGALSGNLAETQAAASALSEDFTQDNLTAFTEILSGKQVTLIKPTSGWYKIKNRQLNKYLYSESNDNTKNITFINDGGDNSKYYWYVTFEGDNATVIGTTGLSMARGNTSATYANASTNYISPITLQAAPDGTATYTEGYFLFPNTHSTAQNAYTKKNAGYDSESNPYILTTWTSTGFGNQYTFEPITIPAGDDIYSVEITGYAPPAAMVTYKGDDYDGNAKVYNGGFYILSASEAVKENFSATTADGFKYTVSVEDNRIYVDYTIDTATSKFYAPGTRATSLATDGTKYFIYNACHVTNGNNRSGFLCNGGTDKVGLNQTWPSAVSTLSNTYLFTLEAATGEGNEGKYFIKSVATGKYVGANGNPTNDTGVALDIKEYSTAYDEKCGTDVQAYKEATADEQTAEDPTPSSHVWVIGNGSTWWMSTANGAAFTTHTAGYPHAFYAVNETAYAGEFDGRSDVTAKTGVGYPTQDARNEFESAANSLGTAINATATYDAAVTAYRSTTDVQMPEDGKAYKIYAVYGQGAKQPLYYEPSVDRITAKDGDIDDPNSMIFICRVVDGKFVFVNNTGKYPLWSDTGDTGKSYSTKGYSDTYISQNAWTIAHAALPSNGTGRDGLTSADFFGRVEMSALNRTGTESYYWSAKYRGANNNETYATFISESSSNRWYDGDKNDRSHTFVIEEATDFRTTVNIASLLPDDTRYVCTYSNSFPTVVPTGVKAYIVNQTNETAAGTRQLADEGEAIPANTGVLLVADANTPIEPAKMKPATTEDIQEATGNLLVGTGATEETVDGRVNAYILANGGKGIGFYKLSTTGSRKIAAYRAYLNLTVTAAARPQSFRISFDEDIETGIDNIEGEEGTNGNAAIYDLSGRRIQKPVKGGLYIKGGVKYIHQ